MLNQMKNDVTDKQQVIDELRKQGINIFPLQPKSKIPSGSWKEYQTKKYTGIIPTSANFAVMGGKISDNLAIIDIDKCSDLKIIEKILPDALNKTLVTKTGSGFHLYVKAGRTVKTTSFVSKDLRVDVRAEGAYVVGPTSIHPDGPKYEIISNTTQILTCNFEQVITKLLKMGLKAIYTSTDAVNIAEGKIEEGQRHDSAIKYANELLFKAHFDKYSTKTRILDWNKGLKKPLPEKEIDKVISDCIDFHNRKKSKKKSHNDSNRESLHNKIANEIMDLYYFLTLDDTKEILIYENGIYQKSGEVIIAKKCEELIPECSHFHVREITGIIQRRTLVKREIFDKDLDEINLKNCIYNTNTGETKNHSPKIPCRVQFPVFYNSKASCPKILNFLKECLEPREIVSVLEQVSSILLRDANLEKAYMHIGDGGNGKSTFFKIVRAFCGPENITNVSIYDLMNNRFTKARLDGKVANIYADIQSFEIKQTGIIKMLISGDAISAEKKLKPAFDFENYAKMFFSANRLPQVEDDSNAIFRRWTITEWPQEFREKVSDQDSLNGIFQANEALKKELITDKELSGLLNILIPLAKNLKKRGRFIHTETIENLRKKWKEQADPIHNFANNFLVVAEEGILSKEEIYNKYKEWCKEKKHVIKTFRAFNSSLFKHIHLEADRQRYNGSKNAIAVWSGVEFISVPVVSDVSDTSTGKTNIPRKKEGLDLFSDKNQSTQSAHLTQNDQENQNKNNTNEAKSGDKDNEIVG